MAGSYFQSGMYWYQLRRQQIADAAIACFARKGYYEASMDDIAREAGISKGSLYWRYPSKRDLFRSLI